MYHFTECPIHFPWWTQEQRKYVHYFLIKNALSFSRSTPYLDFGDFYNAGFEAFLRGRENIKWTREHNGVTYACTTILRGMYEQWSRWYGRSQTKKGLAKREALYSQLSLDDPVRKEDQNVLPKG